ncbi:MAG TPA: preprotein translocase subunit SecG [Enterovirga sp.]
MQTVLIVIHLLIVLALIGVVLLQRSEGGLGLGGGGGGAGGFMTGRGQANALTRATAILAGLFFLTSLSLGILAHRGKGPRSIFDQNAPAAPAGGAPVSGQGPGVLEQIQRMQQAPVPISPTEPATPQVPQSR